nr:glycosyltransferase family 2 protein [Anaerolineae bacterium]
AVEVCRKPPPQAGETSPPRHSLAVTDPPLRRGLAVEVCRKPPPQTGETSPPRHSLKIVHHEQNRGKGAAIRTALEHVTGDVVITQDADLEYDPREYPRLLAPFEDPAVQVVYGSRNLRRNPRSSWSFYWGGRLLSWIANLLYGSHITDEPTGYKVFRADLLRSLDLQSDGFEFCPEVTSKVLRRGIEIHEVPISYRPRAFDEGKKINWRDGLWAIWTLLKYRLCPSPGGGSGSPRSPPHSTRPPA